MSGEADSQEDFSAEVVGCYYYHGVEGHFAGEALKLVREPRNPHDPNAIAVHTMDGRMVGHLSRGTASWFARELDSGIRASVVVTRVDPGTGDLTYGTREHRPPRLGVRISRRLPEQRPVAPGVSPLLAERSANVPSKPSTQPCFVVTAAFGSEDDPMVSFFRAWRDDTLCRHWTGLFLIRLYSVFGSRGARMLHRLPWLRSPVRRILHLLHHLMRRLNAH